MIGLYRLATRLVYALMAPFGLWRARRGSQLWQGRMGLRMPRGPVDIWMHAASVGEVKVLGNLVRYLQRRRPNIALHITTVTATGFKAASEMAGEKATVSFLPLDAPRPMTRALGALQPRMIVVAETEIWPNLIWSAAQRSVPMVLANGRMSERAMGMYSRISGTLGRLLGTYDRFFFKTEEDHRRYARFGVSDSRAEVAGDMKFDAPLRVREEKRVGEIRESLGLEPDDFFFMAGCTRPGEEQLLLDLFVQLSNKYPRFKLGLAPRHLERLDEVRGLLDRAGIDYRPYESSQPCRQAVLVDRMGVLSDLYHAADLAFVGGTLVNLGGHNLLEPVYEQTPVVYGPYLDNVKDAAEYIERHRYGARVTGIDDLDDTVEAILSGRLRFGVKQEADEPDSATARVGDYLMERLGYA